MAMKSTGVVRQLDTLGRIVLPIELRRTMDIGVKDMLEIFVEDDQIEGLAAVGPVSVSGYEIQPVLVGGGKFPYRESGQIRVLGKLVYVYGWRSASADHDLAREAFSLGEIGRCIEAVAEIQEPILGDQHRAFYGYVTAVVQDHGITSVSVSIIPEKCENVNGLINISAFSASHLRKGAETAVDLCPK